MSLWAEDYPFVQHVSTEERGEEICRASRWANGGRIAWTVASGEPTFHMLQALLGNPGRVLSLLFFPAGGAQPLRAVSTRLDSIDEQT